MVGRQFLEKFGADRSLPFTDGRLRPGLTAAQARLKREAGAVRHRSRDAWSRYRPGRNGFHAPSSRAIATTAAGSALAAGAIAVLYAWRHRDRFAVRREEDYELRLLHELRDEEAVLGLIQVALLSEWGPFAPPDLAAMREMAKRAGKLAFVLGVREEGAFVPVALLQTARAPVHGDPTRQVARYPTFTSITDGGTWQSTGRGSGDTAILLQITSFGQRSHGVGSLLRDAALYSLPRSVKYALTTTPVEAEFDFRGDPSEFPPAVKFHYRGGARPAGFQASYKLAPKDEDAPKGRQQHPHVVFMRYTRLKDGRWQDVRRPNLRLSKRSRLGRLESLLRRPRPTLPTRVPQAAPA